MATYTPNMQLKKPAGSDYVQVDDLNGNMDVIDGAVGKLTDLTTTDKTTLVAAINEAAKSGGSENVPYIGDNGNWYIYDPSTMQFKDSGKPSQGDSATVAVGTTTTGAAGTNASVANFGTASAAVLNFTIPRGDKGEKGDKGDTGTGLTILGTYATLSALQAAVTNPNVGDMYNVGSSAPYNIYLWDGSAWKDQGQLQGAKGDKGDPGTAATVSVGTVSTGAPGSNAAVTNSGTESAAVFNFTIPRGNDGASGVTPNVKVGNTTTLAAGSQATVTRRAGSPDSAPIFDFGIPQGAKGDGADITIDAAMSSTSTNPVQNAVITAALNGKANTAHSHVAKDISNLYPVGSIYMSVNSTSPASIYGGTWEQIKDAFLLAAGDTYTAGSTGGEATHTLTVDEIPDHKHNGNILTAGTINGTGGALGRGDWASSITFAYNSQYPVISFNGGNMGGGAHNNMPPYLSVYVWKRTA